VYGERVMLFAPLLLLPPEIHLVPIIPLHHRERLRN
jgi:hypothetical protein